MTKDELEALVRQAVRANIRMSADHLRHGSEMLEQAIEKDGLLVVGAEYSLDSGVVDFFDGVAGGCSGAPDDGVLRRQKQTPERQRRRGRRTGA